MVRPLRGRSLFVGVVGGVRQVGTDEDAELQRLRRFVVGDGQIEGVEQVDQLFGLGLLQHIAEVRQGPAATAAALIAVTRTSTDMRTTERRASSFARAERALAANRLRAPALVANTARKAGAELDRHARWQPAREALWQLIDPYLQGGARVAIVGAGNGDDLPLKRIAERAEAVLIDLDPDAARRARRRFPRGLRSRIEIAEHDVTSGAADAIALAAAEGRVPDSPLVGEGPLPGAPYDLVIGDLLYSQLLYPALLDLGVPDRRRQAFLKHYGPTLTRSVVARLHVSAPYRQVVHLHDPLA